MALSECGGGTDLVETEGSLRIAAGLRCNALVGATTGGFSGWWRRISSDSAKFIRFSRREHDVCGRRTMDSK